MATHGIHINAQSTKHIIYALEFYGKNSLLGSITAADEKHFSEITTVTLAAPSNYRMNSIGGTFSGKPKKLNTIYFHSQPVQLFEIRPSSEGEAPITTDVLSYQYKKKELEDFLY